MSRFSHRRKWVMRSFWVLDALHLWECLAIFAIGDERVAKSLPVYQLVLAVAQIRFDGNRFITEHRESVTDH